MRPARFPCSAAAGVVLLLAASLPCDAAGEPEAVLVPRLRGEIRLDGRSDEAAWQAIEPLPLVTHTPRFGLPASQRSEIRVGYADGYLYAAGRFYVDEPDEILASSLSRDETGADDAFRVLLDTFDDNENAVGFETTPAGVRVDFSVSGDGATVNYDWNTFWDVAVQRDDSGWFAEMRIPISSLRFQPRAEGVTMGLIVSRYSARRNELATYPPLSPEWANAASRPSVARSVRFEALRPRRPFYVTPYVLGGAQRGPAAAGRPADARHEAGLDVKYGITGNLTVDLTANTDFAQAEADDEQVNLSRFSLFFPEKRQFFLERDGTFDFPIGGLGNDPSRLFHSRRIGLTEDGRPLRLYGGGRLVGRMGGWDVGVVDMQAATGRAGVTENLGVVRVRRRVLNEESTVGTLVTSRLATDGRRNLVYAVDTRLRLFATDYLTLQAAGSEESDDSDSTSGAMARILWERPGTLTSKGPAYRLGAKWSGDGFRPGLGFEPRRDFRSAWANLRYGLYPNRGPLRSVQPSLAASYFGRNADGSLESLFLAGFVNVGLRSGALGWIGISHSVEDLTEPLELDGGATVPTGRHSFTSLSAEYDPRPGRRLRLLAGAEVGGFYDGRLWSATLGPTWNPSPHLELGLEFQIQRIAFSSRDQRLRPDLARLRARWALDTRLSARLLLQYNRVARRLGGNVRIRYQFAEGRDLYVVYDEQVATERIEPDAPVSQGRRLLVKYSHSFGL